MVWVEGLVGILAVVGVVGVVGVVWVVRFVCCRGGRQLYVHGRPYTPIVTHTLLPCTSIIGPASL